MLQQKRSLIIDLNKLNKLQSLIQEKSISYIEPSLVSSNREFITFAKSLSGAAFGSNPTPGQDPTLVNNKKISQHTSQQPREKLITSKLTFHSNDENFRSYWTNKLTRSFSMDLDTSRSSENDDQLAFVSESTRYRLLKLDNTILVKSKSEYIYDVVHEKVMASRSVREMKAEGHKKLRELSNFDNSIDFFYC